MFYLTIKTSSHGDLDFRGWEGGYICLDDDQICEGGNFCGVTLTTPATEEAFKAKCRRWWTARRKWLKSMGM